MNFQRVAVNDAGLPNKIIGQRPARQQQEHQYQCSASHHDVEYQQLSHIARVESRPPLERLWRRQVLGPFWVVKLGAAQPAPPEAIPEQDRVHLPGKFIDSPDAVVLNDFTSCIERQAVELANSIDLIPMLADIAVLQGDAIRPV